MTTRITARDGRVIRESGDETLAVFEAALGARRAELERRNAA